MRERRWIAGVQWVGRCRWPGVEENFGRTMLPSTVAEWLTPTEADRRCGRGRREGDEARCHKCDLTGLTSKQCPKCRAPASGGNVAFGVRRPRWRALVAGLSVSLLLLNGPSFGQDRVTNDPVRLTLAHVIEFDDGPNIGETVFSTDGKSIYVLLHPEAVIIWSLLGYHWPEILGLFVAGTVGVALMMAWRAARRKLIPGKPHCRKCSYCLEGCPSDTCPECGHDHSRNGVVVGKPLWRRLLPILTPALTFWRRGKSICFFRMRTANGLPVVYQSPW